MTTVRREETRAALSRAAVDLLERDGIESLTAETIAERAGVSRRTFFNHFDHVDQALKAPINEITEVLIGRFLARPPDEPLRQAVLAVLADPLPEDVLRLLGVVHREAAREDRAGVLARRFMVEASVTERPVLEQCLRDRIGADADPLYVAGLAAAFVAVVERATTVWVVETGGDPATATRHHALTRHALLHLLSGFDESAATTA